MRITRNETPEAIADERVSELLDTGATIVATACQTCLGALSQGIARSGSDAQAADIVELVAKNIRPHGK
ncbi:MAG: (Fe-S)-binding protein [Candidatus Undinarchaeales archaeon]|jgi:Fe-S oxidoreductase|nr:(Fe-S)-binding protein [Candidatus Undinarchaeales archaeon]